MVRLLPEPWVCQTMPPRRSNSPSSSRVFPVCRRSIDSLHRAVLLIAADDLDRAPLDRHEQREVPDDVEQVRGAQHAGDQHLLARQLARSLPELGRDVIPRDRSRVLPLSEVVALRRERPHPRLVEVGGDDELVGVEEALVALVVVHMRAALVGVALQLVDGLDARVR